MKNILWFREISKNDIASVGGKGANLGEMYNMGLPIPPGFCVTAQAYKNFLEESGLDKKIYPLLENLDVEDTDKLYAASEQVQEIILDAEVPLKLKSDIKEAYYSMGIDIDIIRTASKETIKTVKDGKEQTFVAVRSSATAEDLPSIDENSHVFIKINGKPVYDTIKNIYDRVGDGSNCLIEVASMKDNKIKWTRAKQIYRHPANGKKLYKITTETGREITITENHSLITLDKDTLKTKINCIKDLKANEFVPVTRKIDLLNLNEEEINIPDYVNGKDVVCKNNRVYIKNNSSNWKIQNSIKQKLKINEELAYFLGLYCAEGCTYKNNGIIITNSNKQIMDKAKRFFKEISLYNNQAINKNSIRVYCKSFVRLLHKLTGEPLEIKGKGKSCRIKHVPDFIFGCNREIISSFLSGCFDGDGYVSKYGIEYCSTSKKLSGGVVKLLEMMDLDFYIRKKRNAIIVVIPISQAEKFKNIIKLENKSKRSKLDALINNYKSSAKHPGFLNPIFITEVLAKKIKSDFDNKLEKKCISIGICPCCKEEIEKTSYYKNKLRFYCRKCKKAFYENEINKILSEKYIYYDKKGRFKAKMAPWNKALITKARISKNRFKQLMKLYNLEGYCQFLEGDVLWDRITKIEKVKCKGDVYDFTVPKVENFAAGIGGIITHNTASFAGQQATYLNVRGGEELIKAVKKCWASLFTARAIYYRIKNNFEHSKVYISVVIQKMINSDSSGVMFTINPSTNNENEIVIEAGFGLGEVVVGGSITPDRYVIDKNTLEIKEKNIQIQPWAIFREYETGKNIKETLSEERGKQQKVSERNIKILSDLAIKIESHYGVPQDTEFAIEKNKVYIVQARPVTTMKKTEEVIKKEEKLQEKEVIIKGLNAGPGIGSGKVKIIHAMEDLGKILDGDVLVARMTDPDMVPAMKRASAIITDAGGTTCHAAIIGREMGLPVVVGTFKATQILKDNDEVTVDGYTGNIYRGKVEINHEKAEEAKDIVSEGIETVTEIKTIMDFPEKAEEVSKLNPDGVGLLRCEFMILGRKVHPFYMIQSNRKDEFVNNLAEDLIRIASAFNGKPVWYRTLDARTDEFRNLEGGGNEPEEDNPMMGWRSIRRDIDNPEVLKAQFEAIKKVHDQGYTNVGVMIPMITHIDQIKKAKQMLRECGLEPLEEIEFGVMVETPAAIQIIEDICNEGVDFISLGTNDLTQFTLALDRNNEYVQKWYDEMHPAVLKEIEHVLKVCRKYNVETSICGQAGSRLDMIEWLVRHGIDSISVNADMLAEAKRLVYKTERKMLLKFARNGDN